MTRRSASRIQRRRGTTLVEVLVALGMVLVGMLAMFRVLGTSVNGSSTASRLSQAQMRAITILESIRHSPRLALECLSVTAPTDWRNCEQICYNSLPTPQFDACIYTIDRFSIIKFSTTVTPFRDKLVPANKDYLEAATKWVDGLKQSGGTAIDLHIPEAGPLTPQAVDASFDEARAFFPRHFPDEPYTAFACGSWLLDPQLLEYLPEDSNVVQFQRRFELEPYAEPEGLNCDVDVLRFAFRTLTTPLDQLPRRTVLERAIADHLKAGRHWQLRSGRFPI
jgi:type II secretory pathway pseudopilin PulG